jgi:hypothetical protein
MPNKGDFAILARLKYSLYITDSIILSIKYKLSIVLDELKFIPSPQLLNLTAFFQTNNQTNIIENQKKHP